MHALALVTLLSAIDVPLRAEPGVSLALSTPQSEYFKPGGHVFVSVGFGFAPVLDLQFQVGFLSLPPVAGKPVTGPGSALLLGAGGRLHRPYLDSIAVPWLDLGLDYVSTGGLSSLALAAGIGVLFRVAGPFLVGPHLRFSELFKLYDESGWLRADASLLSVGLTLELLVSERKPAEPELPPSPPPLPPADTDGDGARDIDDKCPREPGIAQFDGCPDPDPDHDGVPSDRDRCPNATEDLDGFQDDDGCPDPDNDSDGVLDIDDRCPMVAGLPALKGCPDADGDGVTDRDDECPLKPGPAESKGCPVYKQVVVTDEKIEIKQKIFFAFGKSNILPKSFPLLNEVTAALSDHSRVCVRIEGHTDAVGGMDKNLKLSDDRSKSVLKYLADKSISVERMTAQGYGPTQPLETNATPAGRETNRRVEFVIVPCPGTGP